MGWVAPVIGGIASVAGAGIGAAGAANDRAQALELAQQSVRDMEAIGIPTVEAQRITMERLKSAGKLTPDLEQAIKLGPSAMSSVSQDTDYKTASKNALAKLRGIADSGGMTAEDQANLNRGLDAARTSSRGAREAILSKIRSRGQLGSGLELAAQLDNAQKASQQESQTGLDAASAASKRALEAIQGSGQLAGSLGAEDFSEKARAAAAQDAIDKYNATNQQAVEERNVASKNAGQTYNLNNDQRIADANTTMGNQEQVYNKNLYQTNYGNQLSLATAKANARAGVGSQLNSNANNTAALWSGMGQGVGQIASASADRDLTRDYLNRKYPSSSTRPTEEDLDLERQ